MRQSDGTLLYGRVRFRYTLGPGPGSGGREPSERWRSLSLPKAPNRRPQPTRRDCSSMSRYSGKSTFTADGSSEDEASAPHREQLSSRSLATAPRACETMHVELSEHADDVGPSPMRGSVDAAAFAEDDSSAQPCRRVSRRSASSHELPADEPKLTILQQIGQMSVFRRAPSVRRPAI